MNPPRAGMQQGCLVVAARYKQLTLFLWANAWNSKEWYSDKYQRLKAELTFSSPDLMFF